MSCTVKDETIIEEFDSSLINDNEIILLKGKFHEVDGGAQLTDNNLVARYCFRTLLKYPIIYGYNRYSCGTHYIHFEIEKRGDLRCFFGIGTSLEMVNRVITVDTDNKSLYGWWGLNSFVINGKVQRSKEKNDIKNYDELTLILKCDHQQIELEHHRTKRLLKLSIDITLCPFPWKIVVELPTYGDCVRIIRSSHMFKMATITVKQPCAKCNKGGGVTTCNGCRQTYCTKHFVEHRLELSQQMDGINRDHDVLREDLLKEIPKHSLFLRIDTWEQESISKIHLAAETARNDLQQLLNRTKNDLKLSIEKMTGELHSSQQTDDYTENELKQWLEQLKEFRKKLDSPLSTMTIINDDEIKSPIHLIRICDKQHQQLRQRSSTPTIRTPDYRTQHAKESIPCFIEKQQRPSTPTIRTCDHRTNTTKDSIAEKQLRSSTPTIRSSDHRTNSIKDSITEKFNEIDGKAILSEDNLVVTCCLASILTQPIIYGLNQYSSGKHQIRFRIEKMGDLRLFFGIIRSLENISRSGQAQNNNNNSLYGWWDLNETIINGKMQSSKYRNIVTTGDEITLVLDCDNKQIQLLHHRTKRVALCSIDPEKCPFPWKIVIRLQSAGDCLRILQ
ncbi:unnamed protein product [Adineta steineri]|uniref:Uncharacterized protein n=1 Tax=Adineta steineri TaxID=433720 RepID=A0A814D3W8_9BILA|nr:unnamed protein product [Adineta steineri]